MKFSFSPPPLTDTLEVSVFGTGNGESLAVHLGEGQWMLIDSCMGTSSDLPLSLEYLISLGVEIARDVKLIVATHWHDDHVRGLSKLVEHCSSAKLVISQALEFDEFRKVFGLYLTDHHSFDRDKSGVKEMVNTLNILRDRKAQDSSNYQAPIRTQSDNRIFRSQHLDCEVWSLSPSAASIDEAHQEIKLIWDSLRQESLGGNGPRPPRTAIPKPERNHNSVALWIKWGDKKVLLGADLEECNDRALGWQAVLSCNVFPDGQAGIFKIPHHGSPNGDHAPVWSQIILSSNPVACVTAYNRGKTPRPAPSDIARILTYTNNIHYTSLPATTAPNRYDKTVERTIIGVTKSRKALKCIPGHVQMKWDVVGAISITHSGAAGKVAA